ncbi:hypothetical protein OIU76_013491 [Salix suchowensis]|nr:hypothetical protein OIU76_013491 [Salix suchowensis]
MNPPDKPLLKPLSPQDWESLIEDFQQGGSTPPQMDRARPAPISHRPSLHFSPQKRLPSQASSPSLPRRILRNVFHSRNASQSPPRVSPLRYTVTARRRNHLVLFKRAIHGRITVWTGKHARLRASVCGNWRNVGRFRLTCRNGFCLVGDENGIGSKEVVVGLNYKELRRAMAFLLESPQLLTPSGMMEFLGMVMPMAVALELQASMLKVQFFWMIYSFDPLSCHAVLAMYSRFLDVFDGQEGEIFTRLLLISKETHHYLVFRLLALHWLLGLLSKLMFSGEVGKYKSIFELGLRFYPAVFDPLALKALKLDLLAFYSICLDRLKLESFSGEEVGIGKSAAKLFEDGLVSVSAFKWLPPWSTETAVAFRAFHKFLIGASSHSDNDPSTTRTLMDSTIFHTLQGMLVDMTLQFQRLVPVIVSYTDRLLGCQKHCWLGERLLQTVDELLLPNVKIDYKLSSYLPIFDRIAAKQYNTSQGIVRPT